MSNRNQPESNSDGLPIDPTRERRPAQCQYCPDPDSPADHIVHVIMGSVIDAHEPVCTRHLRILDDAGFVASRIGGVGKRD